MRGFLPKHTRKDGPESKIQDSVICLLRIKGWYVKATTGNMYQSGFPDLFACHSRYGQRWIEIKLPEMKGSHFTAAQLEDFPKLSANGSGVWIMCKATEDEYMKLFKPANWYVYLMYHS
jgi:hypothetical protein